MGAPKELARRFVFAGKEQDIHTGLIDFGARSYDARQGQWLSPDPILADYMQGRPVVGVYRPTNLALYSYAWNNPVSVEDPDGRCPECVFSALRETPEESAAKNEAGKDIAAGVWNSLVRRASATMTAVLLGRPVWAPMPTREEINAAYENSGAKDLDDAGLIDDVPIEAEFVGEIVVDVVGGAAVKGALPQAVVKSFSIGEKISAQMSKRGWSQESIEGAIRSPARTVATRDARHLPDGKKVDEAATAYYSQEGGYVVRNDRTGDIVQISNRNDPNWKAPWDE